MYTSIRLKQVIDIQYNKVIETCYEAQLSVVDISEKFDTALFSATKTREQRTINLI